MTSETVDADDGDRGGVSDETMGGLVTQWCACGYYNISGDVGP